MQDTEPTTTTEKEEVIVTPAQAEEGVPAPSVGEKRAREGGTDPNPTTWKVRVTVNGTADLCDAEALEFLRKDVCKDGIVPKEAAACLVTSTALIKIITNTWKGTSTKKANLLVDVIELMGSGDAKTMADRSLETMRQVDADMASIQEHLKMVRDRLDRLDAIVKEDRAHTATADAGISDTMEIGYALDAAGVTLSELAPPGTTFTPEELIARGKEIARSHGVEIGQARAVEAEREIELADL